MECSVLEQLQSSILFVMGLLYNSYNIACTENVSISKYTQSITFLLLDER